MPYERTRDLPVSVRNTMRGTNTAMPAGGVATSRARRVSRKVAWSAVKEKYAKGADKKWHAKQPDARGSTQEMR
ncbi:cation transport regulator [Dokdonella soli]|uniref:Uncharacterized protein n=1 Tax=Dokdonella soli TaxID=529810 RepID=A0ABN1IF56_9GAMM